MKFKKYLTFALSAAMTASFIPAVSAQAATVSATGYTLSQKAGTYKKAITVKLKAKKNYKVYYTTGKNLSTKKVVLSKKTKSIKINKTTTLKVYAVKSSKKVTAKTLASNTAKKATKSYKYTIKKAVAVNYRYISMNVPYNDFYADYKTTDNAVWEVASGLDAVSTATTSKFSMNTTNSLAEGTYNDGTYIKGVTIPVRVSEADYAKLTTGLAENADYYFMDLTSAPSVYSTLTIGSNGTKSFSKFQDASTVDTSALSVDGYTISGGYGDYQINLDGFATTSTAVEGDTHVVKLSDGSYAHYTIYGAILNTTDGNSYGMTNLENLWFGNKAPNVEIAWSVKAGQQLQRAHGSGGVFYQFDNALNGASLKSVSVITNLGVIDVDNVDLDEAQAGKQTTLDKYYEGDTSAIRTAFTTTDGKNALSVTGIPADLTNPTVSLSYKSGRSSTEVLSNVAASSDGSYALDKLEDGVQYTVTINSDNYGPIIKTLSTGITDRNKQDLQDLIAQAQAANGYATNSDLQEHVQEAQALIANSSATSYDAAELISELQSKIKATYPKMSVTASYTGGSVTLSGLDESKTYTYTITSGSGRNTKTVVRSTQLSGNTIDVSGASLVAGTAYTITLTADGYQDGTAQFTA